MPRHDGCLAIQRPFSLPTPAISFAAIQGARAAWNCHALRSAGNELGPPALPRTRRPAWPDLLQSPLLFAAEADTPHLARSCFVSTRPAQHPTRPAGGAGPDEREHYLLTQRHGWPFPG